MYRKAQLTILALAMSAGCSPGEGETPKGDTTQPLKPRCYSCATNGTAVYVSNKYANTRYGAQYAGAWDWAILGFTNSSPVTVNWGKPQDTDPFENIYSMSVENVTYDNAGSYKLVNVFTPSGTTNLVMQLREILSSNPLTLGMAKTYRGSNDAGFDPSLNLTKIRLKLATPNPAGSSRYIRFHSLDPALPAPIDTQAIYTDQSGPLAPQSEYGLKMPSEAVYLTGYYLEWSTNEIDWKPYCDTGAENGTTSNPEPMIPIKIGQYGSTLGPFTAAMTAGSSSAARTTWACRSGAIATSLIWGYLPWRPEVTENVTRSVIQMKRAAYCGKYSFTNDSIKIAIGDNLTAHVYDPSKTSFGTGAEEILESYWTANGARCIHKQRTDGPPMLPDLAPYFTEADNTCGVPTCTSLPSLPPTTEPGWLTVSAQCPNP